MKQHMKAAAAVGFGLLISSLSAVNAAEIKVISSNALKTVLQDLAPAFEKASEHKLVFTWGAAVPLKARIEDGEAFDGYAFKSNRQKECVPNARENRLGPPVVR